MKIKIKTKKIIQQFFWFILLTGSGVIFSVVQNKITSVSAQVLPILKVVPLNIEFGPSFPQEVRQKSLVVALSSQDFIDRSRIPLVSQVEQVQYAITPQVTAENSFQLCPYLSVKTTESGDTSLIAPYEPGLSAKGTLTFFRDNDDDWLIEFLTPCYKGNCNEEYLVKEFLGRLPSSLNANLLGQNIECEISVEVTKVITRSITKPREPFVVKPPRRPFIVDFPFILFKGLVD